jgi:hypothetical protein
MSHLLGSTIFPSHLGFHLDGSGGARTNDEAIAPRRVDARAHFCTTCCPFFPTGAGLSVRCTHMALLMLVWIIPYIIIVVIGASGWFATTVNEIAFILSIGLLIAYPIYFIGKGEQTPGMKLLQIRLYRLGPNGDL